jgi:hypothetical protein
MLQSHTVSGDDRRFLHDFETGAVPPAAFDHRAHVRLAYILLVDESTADAAVNRMRDVLHAFLRRNGIPDEKYHATLTTAWIRAVRHFMARSAPAESADAFIALTPALLDRAIMLTHYSASVLFSDEARGRFVDPDLDPIP